MYRTRRDPARRARLEVMTQAEATRETVWKGDTMLKIL